jgi:1,2-diacylglycerol 3-beta-glucosyltransferase
MNDRSTDGTESILNTLVAQYPQWQGRFHVVHRSLAATPGKSAVLNDAIVHSNADVFAIFDADAQVDAEFIPTLFTLLMEDDRIAAIQARKVISNANTNLLTRCQQWEYTFDAHLQWCRDLAGAAVELRGNGFLIKRDALEDVQGFNEDSITDDLDLSTRLHLKGWLIRFTHQAQVLEEGVLTTRALIHQRKRWAEGSLRRYLDFGGEILFSKSVGFRTRLDMLVYWVNVLFPILISLELVVVGVSTLLGQAERIHQLLALSLVPLFAVAFIPTLYTAIRRFERPSRRETLNAAVTTGIYMTLLWFSVVFLSFGKVLLRPDAPFKWAKTSHGPGTLPNENPPWDAIPAFTSNPETAAPSAEPSHTSPL